ncbi:MAG: insulinase family protein [Deltaproteobacteria bacterium]|nr:insulinase family protein [Deltaproteobacteria bacterium]
MTGTNGFIKIAAKEIPELRTRAELFRHDRTGCELLSLINDDENKVFGITFRTPPKDSTGVAHILEHSVLCGSRKYPLKEPFVELLKGSLKTFLNAMTYPDKTCYPLASQNVQDFYNLIDVYLDAVFYPRLNPHIFQQEGWHLELEKPDDPLTYKGVVFNEMKGARSSPDNLLAEYSQQSLFPDTPYGFDSGGDPSKIPDLTFEQFKAFHETYYHPSNGRIYFYGDDDPQERLSLVQNYLKDFEAREVDSAVPIQKPLNEPRTIIKAFPSGAAEGEPVKGMVTVNWLLEETSRSEWNLAFHMLEYILLGMPGSPLRKALMDSNLGEDLAGEGLGNDLRQMYFSTGLKGIDPRKPEKVEVLIFDTLKRLLKEGIHHHTVEAAINTTEFILRENNTGSYPRGLLIMLRALTTWLYGEDPLALVAFEKPLKALKNRITSEKRFFETIIDQYLLQNAHRTLLFLKPDPDLSSKLDREERERLDGAKNRMSPEELSEIAANTAALRRMQETPDPPEALAAVPTLKIQDLSRVNKTIPIALSKEMGAEIVYHDLFTSGVTYLDIGFDLHSLPQKYIPYLSLFSRAFLEMGTEEEDYVTLTQRISRKTGGIRPLYHTSMMKDGQRSTVWLFFRAKAMAELSKSLMDILRDVLLKVRLDNKERFRQMVLEAKARQEEMLVPAGHQLVGLRLRAHFNEADWAAEQMGGISQLFFLRDLAKAVDKRWPSVLADLEEMKRILINRESMIINVTQDQASWARFQLQVKDFLETLPTRPTKKEIWIADSMNRDEGMIIPSQVNYAGKGACLYSAGYLFHGSSHVITRYLRNALLWEKVRVQGGAYGAFSSFDRLSGVFTLVSYRDPNLTRTLGVFDDSAQFLEQLDLSDEELTKSIIGTIGDMDQHLLPDAKGYVSLARYLSGETDSDRQKIREEILGTTVSDFRSFGKALKGAMTEGPVTVLGAESAIQQASAQKPGWLKVIKLL